ncbi:MAG: DUF3575 domain-containing protein [Rikenellaceae bacterium]|jgi:hypothetical protein|nr:DUF3575 domain-containing protein [Rikenellaceae bacterium]
MHHKKRYSSRLAPLLPLLLTVTFASAHTDYAQGRIIDYQKDSTNGVTVYYPVNQSLLMKEFYDNASALSQINNLLSDPQFMVNIDSIVVNAYASPEGTVTRNMQLAEERSRAVKSYIMWQFPHMEREKIHTRSRLVDWQEVRKLISGDPSMPQRQGVLKIVDTPNISDVQMVARMKALGGGAAFNYITKHYAVFLRRATSTVYYTKAYISELERKGAAPPVGKLYVDTPPPPATAQPVFVPPPPTPDLSPTSVPQVAATPPATPSVAAPPTTAPPVFVPPPPTPDLSLGVAATTPAAPTVVAPPAPPVGKQPVNKPVETQQVVISIPVGQSSKPAVTPAAPTAPAPPATATLPATTATAPPATITAPAAELPATPSKTVVVDTIRQTVVVHDTLHVGRTDSIYRQTVVVHDTLNVVRTDSVMQWSDFDDKRSFFIAVKTNLLYDIALLPNLSVEYPFGSRWSAVLNGYWSWWDSGSPRYRSHRIQMLGAEARYWLREHDERPMEGFFVGLYVLGGNYDLRLFPKSLESLGYLSLWSWSAGATGGYSMRLAARFDLEFALGLGYFGGRYRAYDRSRCADCYPYKGRGKIDWWGPTNAAVSLVYRIGNWQKQ